MRKILMAAASAAAFVAAPAMAQDRGFYIGGELGAVLGTDTDLQMTPAATAGSTGRITADHALGFAGAGFAGYDFGRIRVEIEAGALSAGVDGLDSSFGVGAGLVAGSQDADGDVGVRYVMANAVLDLGSYHGFAFFVGAGGGRAQVKASEITTSGGAILLDDRDQDWRFAWQGVVGARRPLTDHVDLQVRYRYFSIDDAEMIGLGGRVATGSVTAHTLGVGATWKF